MNAWVIASNMFVFISGSDLFTFFNGLFHRDEPRNKITFYFIRIEK